MDGSELIHPVWVVSLLPLPILTKKLFDRQLQHFEAIFQAIHSLGLALKSSLLLEAYYWNFNHQVLQSMVLVWFTR